MYWETNTNDLIKKRESVVLVVQRYYDICSSGLRSKEGYFWLINIKSVTCKSNNEILNPGYKKKRRKKQRKQKTI